MAKIAYLIGGTGAGKSHLAKQFSDRAHWIELDGIQFCAGRGLFPPNQPELTWKFQAWNIAFEYDDCYMAIRSALDILHGKVLNDHRPILAEGTIAVLPTWRAFFGSALQEFGITLTEQRIFWLDPEPEQVFENIKQRSRKNQSDMSLERSRAWRVGYAERALSNPVTRFTDPQALASALEAFLFDDN